MRTWHDSFPHWYLSTSYPADWGTPTRNAATEWQRASHYKLSYQGRYDSTDFTNAYHIVWRGQIPSIMQSGCPTATTLACTRTSFFTDGHLADADTVMNSQQSMGTSDFNCSFLGSLTYDVQTVVLHELGHFGGLGHDPSSSTVMYFKISTCRRSLTPTDVTSMNNNYPGH